MAISVIATLEGSAINGGDVTLDLSATGVAEGDVVVVFGGLPSSTLATADIETADYVEGTPFGSTSAPAIALTYGYKIMGATPDTEVVCNGGGSGTAGVAYGGYVLRGVDLTNVYDASPVTATGASGSPDGPEITTVTDGALVVVFGGVRSNDSTATEPTGYSNKFEINANDDNDISVGGATLLKATAGAENPDAFGSFGNSRWGAVTLAFRPASAGSDITGEAAITEAGDTVSAAGKVAIAAALAKTEANDTLTSAAALALAGAASITEAGDTLAAVGALAIVGEAAISEAGDTLAAVGAEAAEPEPEPVPESPPILHGGGGFAHGRAWSSTPSEKLLKRIRRSLGLDPPEVEASVLSAAEARAEADDEEVILLALSA